MNGAPTQASASVSYFGKIPSRGDFVRAAESMALISVLDDWLAQTLELLAEDPRWKIIYDAVAPMHFCFIGPRCKHAVAGHMVASRDQAQRRYPFLLMSTMQVDSAPAFMAMGPMVLLRLWNRLEAMTTEVVQEEDAAGALQAVAATTINLELGESAYEAALTDFFEFQTIGGLDALLVESGFEGRSRQVILALGMLLQPILATGSSRIDRSLVLPLPIDPLYRFPVASFWMHLISPFLLRADFELAVFLTRIDAKPELVVGFSGASPRTLQAIMAPQVGSELHIRFDDADWVESPVEAEYGLRKFSSYLEQPQLSLKAVLDSFREAFLGV